MNMMKLTVAFLSFRNMPNMPKNKCIVYKKKNLFAIQNQPLVTATQKAEHNAIKKTEEAEEE